MTIERGYLRLPVRDPRRLRMPVTPAQFQPPERVGNWEYFLTPEEQGQLPWCAAYAECSILQAAAWRSRLYGYPVQFDEEALYAGAKAIDGDHKDGTSLESVMDAARQLKNVARIEAVEADSDEDIPWIIHQFGAALVGMMIDEGWNHARSEDGLIAPWGKELGGHAVVVTWYDKPKRRVGGPNWWGKRWGMSGYWSMNMSDFAHQFVYGYGQVIDFRNE
jgi:hypothetical protein